MTDKEAIQMLFVLNEDASTDLEILLAREVCTYHTGTTLDFAGTCAMCDLDHAQHAAAVAASRCKPEWVRRAEASLLVAKVLQ